MSETLADTGVFTFPRLRSHTGLASNTLRLAVKDLVTSGWMVRSQKNRSSPIRFTLGSLELRHGRNELRAAQRRLKRADFKGEALMKEYLSLLIDSDRFTDNARPGSLANPLTGERLELDRFYLSGVGFEFHGDQHVGESELCSKEESDAQRLRDLIKGGLCVYQDIQLVVIYARDLSIKSILRKIGNRLPLRDLSGRGALIEWLENRTWVYLSNTPASVLLERT